MMLKKLLQSKKKKKKLEGFLVTLDTEKPFDSLDHNFLISNVEKYDFGKNFISWVKIWLRNRESFVLNGDTTTLYYIVFLTWEKHLLRWPNVSFFICFSFRDLIFSYEIETLDSRNYNLWLELHLLCIHWRYNHFLKGCYFYKAYCWHFFIVLFRIKTKFIKIWNCRYWDPERSSGGGMRCIDLNNDTLKY